jgi:hypothetical protein
LESLLSNSLLGVCCAFWGFIANKSIESFTFLGEDLDTFNFTELFKVLSEFIFSSSWREVLYIEVTSLLGILESDLFSTLLSLSILLFQGFSDIYMMSFMQLLMLLLYCIKSSFRAVLFVIRIIEANEGER